MLACEERGVQHEGDAVEGLAPEVHLVFVDEDAAQQRAQHEAHEDHEAVPHLLGLVPVVVPPLQLHAEVRRVARHVADELVPPEVDDDVHGSRAAG